MAGNVVRMSGKLPLPANEVKPLVARNTHIGTSVRSVAAPDSRSEEEAMLIHCDDDEDGAVPPEPEGPVGVVGDIVVAVRRR